MIKNFKIFENSLFTDLSDFDNLEEESLEEIIGFNKNDCIIEYKRFSYEDFDFKLKVEEYAFCREYSIEEGLIKNILSSTKYNIDNVVLDIYELDGISSFLNDDNMNKFKKLLDFLRIDESCQDLHFLFKIFDDFFDYYDLLHELEIEYDKAIKNNISEFINELPFDIEFERHNNNYYIVLEIDIDNLLEFIEEKNLNVNTIKDLIHYTELSNVDSDIFSYYETSYDIDYEDFNKEFEKGIDKIIEYFGLYKRRTSSDAKQLNLFDDDDDYDYELLELQNIFINKLNINDINKGKYLGGKILDWFKSYNFQKMQMKTNNKRNYELLQYYHIIHPKIEKEYAYLVDSEKFNI